jgi:hypothetical protein
MLNWRLITRSSLRLTTLSSLRGKRDFISFSYPLSAKGEERGAQRSGGGVSPRTFIGAHAQLAVTHPVIALPDHPLFAARKEGFLYSFSYPLSAEGEERVAQRSGGGVSPRTFIGAHAQLAVNHLVIAPLDHPLFAARKEGFYLIFLTLFPPKAKRGAPSEAAAG